MKCQSVLVIKFSYRLNIFLYIILISRTDDERKKYNIKINGSHFLQTKRKKERNLWPVWRFTLECVVFERRQILKSLKIWKILILYFLKILEQNFPEKELVLGREIWLILESTYSVKQQITLWFSYSFTVLQFWL